MMLQNQEFAGNGENTAWITHQCDNVVDFPQVAARSMQPKK